MREQSFEPPVLDLGCGDGIISSMVLSEIEIGLDPSPNAVSAAARRGVYERLCPLPIERAPIPARSVGTVLSNSTLEHLEGIDEALCAIARMLRPGGRLVFTVPTEALDGWLAVPLSSYSEWRKRQLIHLNVWSTGQWAERLDDAGLQLEEVRPYLRKGLVRTWDILELMQMVWVGKRRLFGMAWKRLPAAALDRLARAAARLDLSSPLPGGGRLMVARKL